MGPDGPDGNWRPWLLAWLGVILFVEQDWPTVRRQFHYRVSCARSREFYLAHDNL